MPRNIGVNIEDSRVSCGQTEIKSESKVQCRVTSEGNFHDVTILFRHIQKVNIHARTPTKRVGIFFVPWKNARTKRYHRHSEVSTHGPRLYLPSTALQIIVE